jgi:hypothetical protein
MFKLLSFLWSQYIQYLIFTGIIVFSVSCGFEDSAKSIADSNQTELLVKAPVLVPEVLDDVVLADFQNSQVLDLLFEKHISGIVPKITNSIPDPIHFNYERLENSFLKMLMEKDSEESHNKYQFICDENERWIYRCNMETGEIECFSMSSNKLRLLSSVK